MVSTGKIGIIEALDRTDGHWLWRKETVPQNVVAEIDPKTGEKTINPDAMPHIGQTTVNCPADPGGRGWPATAYNPDTQALYLPLAEFCSNTTPEPLDQGQVYTGGGRATFARVPVPDSDGNVGRIDAIDLTDRRRSLVVPAAPADHQRSAADRRRPGLRRRPGPQLLRLRRRDRRHPVGEPGASNAINSFPISYVADGKQYVAVVANSGSSQMRSWGTLDARHQPAVRPRRVALVFALPD